MDATQVEVVVRHGQIPEEVKQRACEKIAAMEEIAPGSLLFARVRFDRPAVRESVPPVVAQAQLDVDGRVVQAKISADFPEETVDLLVDRLRLQLDRLRDRLQTRRHEPEVTAPGQWRHGALPTERPDFYPRPREEREVVRHETYARRPAAPDEAAFDLQMLDYDFHLFVELETGRDAVLFHPPEAEDGRHLAISMVGGADDVPLDQAAAPVKVAPEPPRMHVDGAIERLEAGEEPFVFFVDESTDRGAVVYHRYDGHYGIVVPAAG